MDKQSGVSRATPAQMRGSLELVESLKLEGIRFVPIPCTTDTEFVHLLEIMEHQMKIIVKEDAKDG